MQDTPTSCMSIYKNVSNISASDIGRSVYKGKADPLQVWTDPEGSRSLRLPDFKTVGTLTLRRLMSYIYIYMEHPFLMFLDHTQRRSTVGRTPLDE